LRVWQRAVRTLRGWLMAAVDRAAKHARVWVTALEPREWRRLGAAAASVLVVTTLALTWWSDDVWSGTVPSTAQTVGTCHAYDTEAELGGFSDVRPPVPCTRPHQTETVVVGELTGDLRGGAERMSPEKRLTIVNDLCREPMRAYLGAGPRDDPWRLGVLLRLPTGEEWAAGQRQYRCEIVPKADSSPNGSMRLPSVATSLRGILDTPAGAAYRRCWTDDEAEVACDQPHRSESVNAIAAVPAERVAGTPSELSAAQRAAFHAWADRECVATVSEFLGSAVSRTPYRPVARLTADGKAFECGVALPSDQPMRTGSLAPIKAGPTK
jgi:hypothetical protein